MRGLKEIVSRWLKRVVDTSPWLARLCLWFTSPFPRLYLFTARSAGLKVEVSERIWHISRGPLSGMHLTSLLPGEIGPVLTESVENQCSKLLNVLRLESKVAFDVGASYGYYALLLSRVVGVNGHVFSFEADWKSFQRLTRNLMLNHCGNVTAAPLCLSDSRADLAIWQSFDDEPWRSGLILDGSKNFMGKRMAVPVTTLDAFVAAIDLSKPVGLIKVDVEGAERRVLGGAIQLLTNAKPLMLCELHGADIAHQVFAFLSNLGYEWEIVEYVSENRQHILAFPSEQASTYRGLIL